MKTFLRFLFLTLMKALVMVSLVMAWTIALYSLMDLGFFFLSDWSRTAMRLGYLLGAVVFTLALRSCLANQSLLRSTRIWPDFSKIFVK